MVVSVAAPKRSGLSARDGGDLGDVAGAGGGAGGGVGRHHEDELGGARGEERGVRDLEVDAGGVEPVPVRVRVDRGRPGEGARHVEVEGVERRRAVDHVVRVAGGAAGGEEPAVVRGDHHRGKRGDHRDLVLRVVLDRGAAGGDRVQADGVLGGERRARGNGDADVVAADGARSHAARAEGRAAHVPDAVARQVGGDDRPRVGVDEVDPPGAGRSWRSAGSCP